MTGAIIGQQASRQARSKSGGRWLTCPACRDAIAAS